MCLSIESQNNSCPTDCPIKCAYGCEAPTFPNACDQIPFSCGQDQTCGVGGPVCIPKQQVSCPLHSKGDANCDGKIDTDDFNIWRDLFIHGVPADYFDGSAYVPCGAGGCPNKYGDFNGDNIINTDDFNIWRDGFLNQSLPH